MDQTFSIEVMKVIFFLLSLSEGFTIYYAFHNFPGTSACPSKTDANASDA